MRLRDIPLSELESLTLDKLSEKYGFTAKSISRYRRTRLGLAPRQRGKGVSLKPIPEAIARKWVELYTVDKLTLKHIRERFPDFGVTRISATIRERVGGRLESHRTHGEGWFGA